MNTTQLSKGCPGCAATSTSGTESMADVQIPVRICAACSRQLPHTEFYARTDRPGLVQSECRLCSNKRRNSSRQRQREQIAANALNTAGYAHRMKSVVVLDRATEKLGGPKRTGELLAETFQTILDTGSTVQKLRAFTALLRWMEQADR